MTTPFAPSSGKTPHRPHQPHRIAEQILTASARLVTGRPPTPPRLSREEIEDLVSRTLDRELARLETTAPAGSA